MSWPAVKYALTQEQFRAYVQTLTWPSWRPSLVVWHNTAAPSLAQWETTAEQDKLAGRVPGTTRINNLEQYFRFDQNWSGAPHLFIAEDFIWVFNPLTTPGVHSPSWNSLSWGFEMVGDFSKEDDDAGAGLKVKNNCIFATAVLCAAIGIEPSKSIRLHKEDPRTTHDCPGRDIAQDKLAMISSVVALMPGGEHTPPEPKEKPVVERYGLVTVEDLNFRRGPSASEESTGTLPKGTELTILDSAKNQTTEWFKVRTPAGYVGWVAGKYIQEIKKVI